MSHHHACLCSNPSYGFYADCTCATLYQRDHTAALQSHEEALRRAPTDEVTDLRARVEELERKVEGLLDRYRQPPDVASWI